MKRQGRDIIHDFILEYGPLVKKARYSSKPFPLGGSPGALQITGGGRILPLILKLAQEINMVVMVEFEECPPGRCGSDEC